MIRNDEISKQDFKFLTVNQVRLLMQRQIKHQDQVEKHMKTVEDQAITGFQLKDILSDYTSFEDISKAL